MANYNYPSLGHRSSFKLDLTRLPGALEVNSSTGPVTRAGMATILDIASQVTKIPLEFFEVILELECSYPTRESYSSSTPRDGDGNKRLPDPRYPHPSAYSARPPKGRDAGGQYYGLANVNRGTQIYIGISQMSFEFWQDVKAIFASKGVNKKHLPAKWWEAPLLIQLIAPLVYFERYGSQYATSALITPSTVYMLHQQGPGWVQRGLPGLAGVQSVKTAAVVTAARRAAGGYI